MTPPREPLPDFVVRPATGEDVAAMTRLLSELFSLEADFQVDPERQRRGLELLLADARSCVLVAQGAGGEVIGMVTGQLVISTAEAVRRRSTSAIAVTSRLR